MNRQATRPRWTSAAAQHRKQGRQQRPARAHRGCCINTCHWPLAHRRRTRPRARRDRARARERRHGAESTSMVPPPTERCYRPKRRLLHRAAAAATACVRWPAAPSTTGWRACPRPQPPAPGHRRRRRSRAHTRRVSPDAQTATPQLPTHALCAPPPAAAPRHRRRRRRRCRRRRRRLHPGGSPPRHGHHPIDAPCTHCLRHGDPMLAQK
jgi:hypothetical protein